MSKLSIDYQKLIKELDELQDRCKEVHEILTLKEAMDVISDYEKVVADSNRMIQQYETPERARRIASEVYVCPHCGRRIRYRNSHCHFCGKRISW